MTSSHGLTDRARRFLAAPRLRVLLLTCGLAGSIGLAASCSRLSSTASLADASSSDDDTHPDSSASFTPDVAIDRPATEPEGAASLENGASQELDAGLIVWEDLYRQALALLAERQFEKATDLLFVLQDQVETDDAGAPADAGSAMVGSRSRRLVHLAGLLAEGQAIGELTAASDSALAASYGRLRGLAFPDSLVPITGRHRRALAADLLRVDNPAVQQWIDYFTGPGRRQFDHWLSRKASTDSLVTALLDRAGLPRELLYLAMIESGLSCYARSGVGAVGPWQFMPGTAKRYGLRCDWWVDERRDLELSTRAAVAYLSTLYEQFQDWALVLAAYNAGEARIARAIQRAGHDNFWRLHLPQQTAAHIPKFIAAARIGEAPARFGFAEAAKEPLAYDVVEVSDATDLGVIAKCAGVPDDELPALNPALLRRTSPPDSPRYPVRVPFGCGDRCERELRRIPPERRLTWRQHRVASGQTLSHIASQYGTSVTSLREANHLKNVNMIRPGDQLLIPMPAVLADKARQREEEKGHYVPPDGYERVSYRVKAGDTLGAIARRLGVSLKHLRKVNGLSSSLIRPGQKLYAYRPPRLSSASEAADREGG